MPESAVTSKGQTTLPKSVRQVLGVISGHRARYVISDNRSSSPDGPTCESSIRSLKYDGPPVRMEGMKQTGVKGAYVY